MPASPSRRWMPDLVSELWQGFNPSWRSIPSRWAAHFIRSRDSSSVVCLPRLFHRRFARVQRLVRKIECFVHAGQSSACEVSQAISLATQRSIIVRRFLRRRAVRLLPGSRPCDCRYQASVIRFQLCGVSSATKPTFLPAFSNAFDTRSNNDLNR